MNTNNISIDINSLNAKPNAKDIVINLDYGYITGKDLTYLKYDFLYGVYVDNEYKIEKGIRESMAYLSSRIINNYDIESEYTLRGKDRNDLVVGIISALACYEIASFSDTMKENLSKVIKEKKELIDKIQSWSISLGSLKVANKENQALSYSSSNQINKNRF